MAQAPLHILIVEDNQILRDAAHFALAQLGYEVHAASSAEDALPILHQQTIDILLTDIALPGMSGIKLAQQATQRWPQLKIIFASGFGYLVTDRDQTNFEFILLAKPYSLNELQGAVERIAKASNLLA